MPLRSVVGSVVGFCVGVFVKQLTRKIMYYLGLGFVSIALLCWLDYVKINWNKIDEDLYYLIIATNRRSRE